MQKCWEEQKDQEILAQIYMGFEWARSLPLPSRPHNYNVKKQISFSHARLYNPSNFTKNELIDYVSQYYPQHKNSTIILNRIIDLQPDLDQQSLRQNKLLVEGQNLKNQIIFLQTIAEHKTSVVKISLHYVVYLQTALSKSYLKIHWMHGTKIG